MHNICTFAGCGYGTDAFKEKWARDLTSGCKLANFALTEPQSGSDPMKMYTGATINDDGTWTISGAKAWVSLAGEADIYFTVVIGRALQKRAASLPDLPVPMGFGEKDADAMSVAAE